jgi:glycine oxidase
MPEAVVIGGGVMGLGAARELRRRGFQVTLLERAQPGRAASWASAGIIGATTRDEADPNHHLREVSRGLWPGFAATLKAESGVDPEYRETGCLFVARHDGELAWVRQTAHADNTPVLDYPELRHLEPAIGPAVRGGLALPGGNVENRRLCKALEIAAVEAGVDVRSGVEVRGVVSHGGRVAGVETGDGGLSADTVIVAAGAWSGSLSGVEPRVPVRPQRGQILAVDHISVGLRHTVLTETDPYLVPRADGRLIVGATREEAGWDASLTAGGVGWLLTSAIEIVPALRECPIVELWTGFRPMSADGVPAIGRGALDGLYFLTGHGPSGIAPLPASIALLGALVSGEHPPVDPAPFSPLRFAAKTVA